MGSQGTDTGSAELDCTRLPVSQAQLVVVGCSLLAISLAGAMALVRSLLPHALVLTPLLILLVLLVWPRSRAGSTSLAVILALLAVGAANTATRARYTEELDLPTSVTWVQVEEALPEAFRLAGISLEGLRSHNWSSELQRIQLFKTGDEPLTLVYDAGVKLDQSSWSWVLARRSLQWISFYLSFHLGAFGESHPPQEAAQLATSTVGESWRR